MLYMCNSWTSKQWLNSWLKTDLSTEAKLEIHNFLQNKQTMHKDMLTSLVFKTRTKLHHICRIGKPPFCCMTMDTSMIQKWCYLLELVQHIGFVSLYLLDFSFRLVYITTIMDQQVSSLRCLWAGFLPNVFPV